MEQGTRIFLLILLAISTFLSSANAAPLIGDATDEFGSERECLYQSKYYPHGTSIETEEACLNCTCNRGVLVCFLRVCHNLVAPPNGDCRVAKLPGRCCSEIICGAKEVATTTTTTTVAAEVHSRNSNRTAKPDVETTDPGHRQEEATSQAWSSSTDVDTSSYDEDNDVTTLSPGDVTVDDNAVAAGCLFNKSFYGEGSAMPSINLCEYCYCIRGNARCIKPQCHLHIDQCHPVYQHDFSCCPSAYQCSTNRRDSESILTTTTTAPSSSEIQRECLINGTVYAEGDPIAQGDHCQNCFCAAGGIRCSTIQCAVKVNGCQPIIMPGKCCPTAYTCTPPLATDPIIEPLTGFSDESATDESSNTWSSSIFPDDSTSVATDNLTSTVEDDGNSNATSDIQDASESRASSKDPFASNSTETDVLSAKANITQEDPTPRNGSVPESIQEDMSNDSFNLSLHLTANNNTKKDGLSDGQNDIESSSEFPQNASEVSESTFETDSSNTTELESDALYAKDGWSDSTTISDSITSQPSDEELSDVTSPSDESTSRNPNELSVTGEEDDLLTDSPILEMNNTSEFEGKNGSIFLADNETRNDDEIKQNNRTLTSLLKENGLLAKHESVIIKNNTMLINISEQVETKSNNLSNIIKDNLISDSQILNNSSLSASSTQLISDNHNNIKAANETSVESDTLEITTQANDFIESTLATLITEEQGLNENLTQHDSFNNTLSRNNAHDKIDSLLDESTDINSVKSDNISTSSDNEDATVESTTEIVEITTEFLEKFLQEMSTINYNRSQLELEKESNGTVTESSDQDTTSLIEARHPVTNSVQSEVTQSSIEQNNSSNIHITNTSITHTNNNANDTSKSTNETLHLSNIKEPFDEYIADGTNNPENILTNVTASKNASILFGSLNSIVNLLLEEEANVTDKPLDVHIHDEPKVEDILTDSALTPHLDAILEDLVGDVPGEYHFDPVTYVDFNHSERSNATQQEQIDPTIASETKLTHSQNKSHLQPSSSTQIPVSPISTVDSIEIATKISVPPIQFANITLAIDNSTKHTDQYLSNSTEPGQNLQVNRNDSISEGEPINYIDKQEAISKINSSFVAPIQIPNVPNIEIHFSNETDIKNGISSTTGNFSNLNDSQFNLYLPTEQPNTTELATDKIHISVNHPELELPSNPFVEGDLQTTLEMILNLSKTFAISNNRPVSWAPSLNQTYDDLLNGTIPSNVEAKLTEIIRLAQAELLNKGEPMHFNESILPFFHKFSESNGFGSVSDSNNTDDDWSPTEPPHGVDYYDYETDTAPVTIPNAILQQLSGLKNLSLTSQISGDIHRDTDQHTDYADDQFNTNHGKPQQTNESVIQDLHKIFLPLLNLSQSFSHSTDNDEPGRSESSQISLENENEIHTTAKPLITSLRNIISEQLPEDKINTSELSVSLVDLDRVFTTTLAPVTLTSSSISNSHIEIQFNDNRPGIFEDSVSQNKSNKNIHIPSNQNPQDKLQPVHIIHKDDNKDGNTQNDNRDDENIKNQIGAKNDSTINENQKNDESQEHPQAVSEQPVVSTIHLDKDINQNINKHTELKEEALPDKMPSVNPQTSILINQNEPDVNHNEHINPFEDAHTTASSNSATTNTHIDDHTPIISQKESTNLNENSQRDTVTHENAQNDAATKDFPIFVKQNDTASIHSMTNSEIPDTLFEEDSLKDSIQSKVPDLVNEDVNEKDKNSADKVEPIDETQYSHAVGPDEEKSYFGLEDYENSGSSVDRKEEVGGEVSAADSSALDANNDDFNKNSPDEEELHHYSEHGSFFDLPLDSKVDSQLEYRVDEQQFPGIPTIKPTSQIYLKNDDSRPFDTTIKSSDWRPIERLPSINHSIRDKPLENNRGNTATTNDQTENKQEELDYSNTKETQFEQEQNIKSNQSILGSFHETNPIQNDSNNKSPNDSEAPNKPIDKFNPINIPSDDTLPINTESHKILGNANPIMPSDDHSLDESPSSNQPLDKIQIIDTADSSRPTGNQENDNIPHQLPVEDQTQSTPTIKFSHEVNESAHTVDTEQNDNISDTDTSATEKNNQLETPASSLFSDSNKSQEPYISDSPIAEPLELQSNSTEDHENATNRIESSSSVIQDPQYHQEQNVGAPFLHGTTPQDSFDIHDEISGTHQDDSNKNIPQFSEDSNEPVFDVVLNDTYSKQPFEHDLTQEPFPGTHQDAPLPHFTTEDFVDLAHNFNTNIDPNESEEASQNNTSPFVGLMTKGSIVFENVLPLSRRGRPNVDEITGQIHPTPRKSGSHPQTPATDEFSPSLTPEDVQVIPFLPEDAITEALLHESAKPTTMPRNRDSEPSIISKEDFVTNGSSIAVKVSASTSMQVHNEDSEDSESTGAVGAAEPISIDDEQHRIHTSPAATTEVTITTPTTPTTITPTTIAAATTLQPPIVPAIIPASTTMGTILAMTTLHATLSMSNVTELNTASISTISTATVAQGIENAPAIVKNKPGEPNSPIVENVRSNVEIDSPIVNNSPLEPENASPMAETDSFVPEDISPSLDNSTPLAENTFSFEDNSSLTMDNKSPVGEDNTHSVIEDKPLIFNNSPPTLESTSQAMESTAHLDENTHPVIENEPPGVENESPVDVNESPLIANESPMVGKEPTFAENKPSNAENEPPNVKNESPIVENHPLVVENEPAVIENESPIVENPPPVVENEPPIVENDPPIVENDPPIVENEPPVVESETQFAENEAPVENGHAIEENVNPVVDNESPVAATAEELDHHGGQSHHEGFGSSTTLLTGHRPKSDDSGAIDSENDGADYCVENGEVFNNGERIPTHNICAQCKCVRGVVQCQHAACPQRPPGCVERILSSSCCPTFVCNETDLGENNSGTLPIRSGITIHGGFLPIDGPILPVTNTEQQHQSHPNRPHSSHTPHAPLSSDRIDIPSSETHHESESVHTEEPTTSTTTTTTTTESTGLFGSILAGIFGGSNNTTQRDPPSVPLPADGAFDTIQPEADFHFSEATTTTPSILVRTTTEVRPLRATSTGVPSRRKATTSRSRTRAPTTASPIRPTTTEMEAATTRPERPQEQATVASTKGSSPFAGLWPMLKVSGCNIYGRVYEVGKTIGVLSGPCKECKCGDTGVECYRVKCF